MVAHNEIMTRCIWLYGCLQLTINLYHSDLMCEVGAGGGVPLGAIQ